MREKTNKTLTISALLTLSALSTPAKAEATISNIDLSMPTISSKIGDNIIHEIQIQGFEGVRKTKKQAFDKYMRDKKTLPSADPISSRYWSEEDFTKLIEGFQNLRELPEEQIKEIQKTYSYLITTKKENGTGYGEVSKDQKTVVFYKSVSFLIWAGLSDPEIKFLISVAESKSGMNPAFESKEGNGIFEFNDNIKAIILRDIKRQYERETKQPFESFLNQLTQDEIDLLIAYQIYTKNVRTSILEIPGHITNNNFNSIAGSFFFATQEAYSNKERPKHVDSKNWRKLENQYKEDIYSTYKKLNTRIQTWDRALKYTRNKMKARFPVKYFGL